MTSREALALADVTLDVANDAPDSDLETFAACCRNGGDLAADNTLYAAMVPRVQSVGFDPTIILVIIQAIMALFDNCPQPNAAMMKRRGVLARSRLAAAIRRAA